MAERLKGERRLSEERKTYLEERITERFCEYFGFQFGERGKTLVEIHQVLDEVRTDLSQGIPAEYPDGASMEDALVYLLKRLINYGEGSTDRVVEFTLLWGERFGAGEFDGTVRVINLINNAKIQADSQGRVVSAGSKSV